MREVKRLEISLQVVLHYTEALNEYFTSYFMQIIIIHITIPIIRGKTGKTLIDFRRIDCHEVREYYIGKIYL